jgi:hypothetical protein
MLFEEMQVIVDRAAELLPDPPGPCDPQGYASWAALTVDTGYRLARLLGADAGLCRSLSDDEHWTPVACRQRRRLLLDVAMLAALRMNKSDFAEAGSHRPPLIVGNVVESAVVSPRLPAPRAHWLDAA